MDRERNLRKKKKLAGIKSQMKYMTKEAIKAAIIKKRECNDKAQKVVLTMIERDVSEETLLSNLIYINKTHYDDVVEERAVSKMCGYPLCSNELTSIPTKQYHISTVTNKVYDITERKNYCSNKCFKAGSFLKDQLYSSPLWLRDQEEPIKFKLLPLSNSSGLSGAEVLSYKPLPIEDDGISNDISPLKENQVQDEKDSLPHDTSGSSLDTKCLSANLEKLLNLDSPKEKEEIDSPKPFGEIVEKTQPEELNTSEKSKKKIVKKETKLKKTVADKESLHNIIIKMENTIRTWFTFDTARFILGEDKIKEELTNFGVQVQNTQEKADPFFIDRYNELCRRVNMMELKDTYGTVKEVPSNPTPTDFAKLREEAKLLEIKVRSFYRGDMRVEFEEPESELPEDAPLPILPIIDHHAAHITRRNIVLKKFSRTLPEIQLALGISRFNFRDQIKEFVSSLNLTASNISLRPFEWNIATIVFIKLLSLRNDSLRSAIELEEAKKYLEMLFKSYELDLGYLDRLAMWLLDFNYLINTYVEPS